MCLLASCVGSFFSKYAPSCAASSACPGSFSLAASSSAFFCSWVTTVAMLLAQPVPGDSFSPPLASPAPNLSSPAAPIASSLAQAAWDYRICLLLAFCPLPHSEVQAPIIATAACSACFESFLLLLISGCRGGSSHLPPLLFSWRECPAREFRWAVLFSLYLARLSATMLPIPLFVFPNRTRQVLTFGTCSRTSEFRVVLCVLCFPGFVRKVSFFV